MFCHVCGKKMADTAVFCHSCGTKRIEENAVEQAQSEVTNSTYGATQTKNHRKIGIIATLAVLIPIIGVVTFFVMRTESEGESALADAPTTPAYAAQASDQAAPSLSDNVSLETDDILHSDYAILTDGIEYNLYEPLVDISGWGRVGYLRMPPGWDFGEVHRLCGSTGEIIPHEEATRYDRESGYS